MSEKKIKDIISRLNRLEKAVFGNEQKTRAITNTSFKGAKGGCLYLFSKGFFNKKKTAPETKKGLEDNNYNYSIQVVQTTLNRLAEKNGFLVALKEKGKKLYVKRK